MIIIIDGYNLLKQIYKPNKSKTNITTEQRNFFIKKMIFYTAKKKHKIIIAFDGGDISSEYWETIVDPYLHVVYSGYSQTADDVIKSYIKQNNLNNILLVSSDRELCIFASRLGIETINSNLFYNNIQKESENKSITIVKSKDILKKISLDENPELDLIMQESNNFIMHKNEDSYENKEKIYSKKLSKNEKKLLKITKKL